MLNLPIFVLLAVVDLILPQIDFGNDMLVTLVLLQHCNPFLVFLDQL